MSSGPSTFGTMITSSTSPISLTRVVMSSSAHGDSSAFTRVQSAVPPRSSSRPTRTSPSRAASLFSTAIASSRLPSTMSARAAMSGSFPTSFSFDGSKKWIIRDGVRGISRSGSGAPMASGAKKSLACRMDPGWFHAETMSTDSNHVDTDQATREASGGHPYGRYFEEFEVGAVYKHWPAKTVTEADDHLFCLITMNHHPLHINVNYAEKTTD